MTARSVTDELGEPYYQGRNMAGQEYGFSENVEDALVGCSLIPCFGAKDTPLAYQSFIYQE
jgi:hypothetical protein